MNNFIKNKKYLSLWTAITLLILNILVSPYYDDRRYDDIYELLNTIGNNKYGDFNFNVRLDNDGNVINSTDYLKYANDLKLKVEHALNVQWNNMKTYLKNYSNLNKEKLNRIKIIEK